MIAYYVHHHGTGHANRAASIASKLRTPVIGLSTRPPPDGWGHPWLRLADDAPGVDGSAVDMSAADVTAHSTLHWVPRHHEGLRRRMGAISSLLASGRIELLVCDVSVEVAVLARLHGVPVVVMAQPGERTDRAHRLALDLADKLLAPWPSVPSRPWPAAWLTKTAHLGAFSRYDDRPRIPREQPGRRVLVVWGSGGVDVAPGRLHDAARATPGWTWQLAGPPRATTDATGAGAPNVEQLGWVQDLWPALCRADVVITHAGQNAVAEVAAARRPAVVIPQERPYGEQRATAEALDTSEIATVVPHWPDAASWPRILEHTAQRDGGEWARWSSGRGALRAAEEIEGLLCRRTP